VERQEILKGDEIETENISHLQHVPLTVLEVIFLVAKGKREVV
jgi:hypothetical protein